MGREEKEILVREKKLKPSSPGLLLSTSTVITDEG
jgi:hypothetical protein